MLKLLQELHIKIYMHVVLVGIKQPEIIFGNLINKLNYESKSKRWENKGRRNYRRHPRKLHCTEQRTTFVSLHY